MDDIRLQSQIGQTIPMNFESTITDYKLLGFGGTASSIVANPDPIGNSSANVATSVRGWEPWAGTSLPLEYPYVYATGKKIVKMKVWSPAIGTKVEFKFDYGYGNGAGMALEALTTVANAWEELTFDFSGLSPGEPSMSLVVVSFDLGSTAAGTVYYFDDITLN
jgi:hypothetical protein